MEPRERQQYPASRWVCANHRDAVVDEARVEERDERRRIVVVLHVAPSGNRERWLVGGHEPNEHGRGDDS